MKFEFSPNIAFQVKDYDKAIPFYRDVLGMEVVSSGKGETHLRCGPMNFYAESADGGATFLEFKVENVSEATEILEQNGCRMTQEYSPKSRMFADPFGMRFHIWED